MSPTRDPRPAYDLSSRQYVPARREFTGAGVQSVRVHGGPAFARHGSPASESGVSGTDLGGVHAGYRAGFETSSLRNPGTAFAEAGSASGIRAPQNAVPSPLTLRVLAVVLAHLAGRPFPSVPLAALGDRALERGGPFPQPTEAR